MDIRPLSVAALSLLALAGIAFAADTQMETFLKPQELTNGFGDRAPVQGNLIALTGFLVAGAVTAIGAVMATAGWRQRFLPLVTMFLSTYLLVLVIQTAMLEYQAVDVARSASFSISPIFINAEAAPSIYIGPFAIVMAAAIGLTSAARRLMGRSHGPKDPQAALYEHLATSALVVPFLAILLWGNLQVLMALPSDEASTLPYLFVLPLSALAGVGLMVIMVVKAWHLGQFVRNGRLGVVAHDAWTALRRAEWVVVGVLAGLGLMSIVLSPIAHPMLQADRAFSVTARTHAQGAVLLLVIMVPNIMLHRPVLDLLQKPHVGTSEVGPHPLAIAHMSVIIGSVLLAGFATMVMEGALWAWAFASVPMAVYALIALRPQDGLLPAMFAALVLWGIGNTIKGDFELIFRSDIEYATHPGLLALWRALAVLMVAWAVARAARAQTAEMRRPLAWPLTAGLGAAIALILLLELPFSAWIVHNPSAEFVGIGTVVASQDSAVRAVIHSIAGLASFLTGLAVARLHRPDWFAKEAPLPHLAPVEGQT